MPRHVTVFHNPACGTSRAVLALVRAAGIEPVVVEYLKQPPTREEVLDLVRRMGVPLRAVLRRKGTPYTTSAWATRRSPTTRCWTRSSGTRSCSNARSWRRPRA